MNQFKPASSIEKSFFSEEPMFLYDYKSLQIIDVNICALYKYGYTKDELLEKKITELGSRISVEADRKSGSDLIDPQSVWNHLKKDGSQFTVQLTTHLFSYEGKPVKLAIAHDISDKLDQLKNNPYLFPRIETRSGNFPLAIIEWDGELRVRECSGKAKEIFGWGSAEVLNRNLSEIGIIPNSIKDATLENIRKLTGDKLSFFTTESEYLTKDGSTIYCLWHNSAVYDEFGQLMSVYSIFYDISDNKEAESKLIESEQRFRVLTEASLVGVYMVQDMMFRYVNPRFCDILGYTEEELLNKKDPMDLILKDDAKKLMQLREKWFNSEIDSFELDFRAIAKSGRIIEVRVFGSRILIKNKAAVIGVVLDQTTQMEAISNFKESVESYRDLFDSIGDAIYIQDETGKFMEVNQGAVEMYGYDKGYFPGKNPADLSAPGKVDLEQAKELFEKALKGEPQRFEWWGKRKNGEIFPKEIRLTPGKYFGQDVVIAVARDVTEQFEQQTELRHNEILFRKLFQNAPIGIAMLDEHKDIHMINHGFEEIFGFKEEEI
jgi:PAS domain S-box-containing protein